MKEAEAISQVIMHKDWWAADGRLQRVVLQHRKMVEDSDAVDEVLAKCVESRCQGDQVHIIQVLLFHV